MNERQYETIVRWFAAAIAIALGIVSFYFSKNGFGIRVPSMAWIGWIFGVSIIVIEMVFKQRGFNHEIPIIALSFLAYGYGLWSNYIGLQVIMVETDPVFTGMIAAFLEFSPEFLLVWALMGDKGILSSRSRFIPNFGKATMAPPPIMAGGNGHPAEFTTPMGKRIPFPPHRR